MSWELCHEGVVTWNKYYSVAIVRIDSFKPADHLVDIELQIPLKDYETIAEDFLESIRRVISPWYPKVHIVYGQQDLQGSTRRKLLASTDDTKLV